MIGALALSEIAARFENAANAGDPAVIRNEHDDMLVRYNAVVDAILAFVGAESGESDKSAVVDDEVLEFLPDSDS
jgi:hypothetical protein